MIYLLDVNVLIGLLDKAHVHHERARRWFTSLHGGWATCPITELGVVRILGQPAYRNSPGGPAEVIVILDRLRRFGDHHFWPDDISLLDANTFDPKILVRSGQVTDSYLLGLASAHGGQLATFDTRLQRAPVLHADAAVFMIP